MESQSDSWATLEKDPLDEQPSRGVRRAHTRPPCFLPLRRTQSSKDNRDADASDAELLRQGQYLQATYLSENYRSRPAFPRRIHPRLH